MVELGNAGIAASARQQQLLVNMSHTSLSLAFLLRYPGTRALIYLSSIFIMTPPIQPDHQNTSARLLNQIRVHNIRRQAITEAGPVDPAITDLLDFHTAQLARARQVSFL